MSDAEHHPLKGVHDETIYGVLNEKRGQSWFDKCNALESALVRAGWTPPAGHPLAEPFCEGAYSRFLRTGDGS
jgi:hypothetical protein